MKISPQYQDEYKALRYGIMIHSNHDSVKIEGYRQLITIATKLNWFIIKDYLVSEAKSSTAVTGAIGKLLIENKTDRALAQVTKVQDDFFSNVCMNQIEDKKHDICMHAIEYFNEGAFKEFNTIFGRFVKNVNNVDENIINNLVVKYFVSSVILRRFNDCYNDIALIQTKYTQYDYQIFLFLLKLIEGNLSVASLHVFQIQGEISEETVKMIFIPELQFYFLVVLALTFQREWAKNLIIKEDSIVYKYNEENPDFFKLLKTYENCDYQGVISEFEQISQRIETDPLLGNNFTTICSLIKANVLKEILYSSKKITFDTLKKMLKEENSVKIEAWITDCIEKNNMNASIDDVEKVVYINEKDVFDYNVDACLKMSQKNIVDHLQFLMDNAIFVNIDKELMHEQNNIQIKDLSPFSERSLMDEGRERGGGGLFGFGGMGMMGMGGMPRMEGKHQGHGYQ